MATLELKLKQKNEFQYQLKQGAKVVEKIDRFSGDKWMACFSMFDSLDDAVEYARQSREDFMNCLGGNHVVKVIRA